MDEKELEQKKKEFKEGFQAGEIYLTDKILESKIITIDDVSVLCKCEDVLKGLKEKDDYIGYNMGITCGLYTCASAVKYDFIKKECMEFTEYWNKTIPLDAFIDKAITEGIEIIK